MTHIALDIQHASNLRLSTPDNITFPSLSDVDLSRMSSAHARKQAAAAAAEACTNPAASTSAAGLSHDHDRPASALSVVSAETTNSSSDGGDSSSTCTPDRPHSPVTGIVTKPLAQPTPAVGAQGPAAVSVLATAIEPCSPSAADGTSATPDAVAPSPPVTTAAPSGCTAVKTQQQQQQRQVARRHRPWADGVPPEGRAACMLEQNEGLWDTFIAAVHCMLRSSDLGQQHDAAFAVQVAAFSSERLSQKLIDAGVLPISPATA